VSVYVDLLRYRELFGNLWRRDLRAKYKGSVLGVAWSLVNPLLLMGVYTLVFSLLWKAVGGIPHYPLFLLCGLCVWIFFSSTLTIASRSLVDAAGLIRKVRFPRQLVPLSVVATQLVTFAVMLVALMILDFALIPETRKTVWLALPISVAIVALVGGVALIVASLNVLFRDIEHLIAALLLPWFFLTPIIYSFEQLPGAVTEHQTLVEFLRYANFITPPINALRDPLFWGRLPGATDVVYLCVAAVVSLVLGAYVFTRADDRVAVEL
jgi:lipopolysaccharide transport system permease protein